MFTLLLLALALVVLLFGPGFVVFDGIKIPFVSFTGLLFLFPLFVLLIVVVVVVALIAASVGRFLSSYRNRSRTCF